MVDAGNLAEARARLDSVDIRSPGREDYTLLRGRQFGILEDLFGRAVVGNRVKQRVWLKRFAADRGHCTRSLGFSFRCGMSPRAGDLAARDDCFGTGLIRPPSSTRSGVSRHH